MKKKIYFSLLSMLIVFLGCGEDNLVEPETCIVSGNVSDGETMEAINGVKIMINDQETITEGNGNYEIRNLPTGSQEILAIDVNFVLFKEEVSLPSGSLVIDIELEKVSSYCDRTPTISYWGKDYNTVTIGNQCWLKENLNVGVKIDGSEESSNNRIVEKYCYSNNESNCETYGGLYQWNEAMQYETIEGAQGICPDGWHIPTFEEYDILIDAVDQSRDNLRDLNGFSLLYAGRRDAPNDFGGLGGFTAIWSSLEQGSDNAFYIWMDGARNNIFRGDDPKDRASSVRCLKD